MKMINTDKIPLLTYFSPSHEKMFKNYFYPSYEKYLSTDFELFTLKAKQKCDALFEQGNWNKQVKEKINFVNDFIQSATCKYFVFSDVDIIFYKNIKERLIEELENFDIAIQNDSLNGMLYNLCSGFYFCRINDSTKLFFENMVNNYRDDLSDQRNLNLFLRSGTITYKALSNRFFNFAHTTGETWYSGTKVSFPEFPIIMYHANYTVGTANKEFLLQAFKDWGDSF